MCASGFTRHACWCVIEQLLQSGRRVYINSHAVQRSTMLRGSGLACLGASSSFYGHSMSFEQAIMRLELCMFDLGGIWTGSFGRFTPYLCLIPSMHDS